MVEQSNNSKSLLYLIFIRHGERSDQSLIDEDQDGDSSKANLSYKSQAEHDPSLTNLGL